MASPRFIVITVSKHNSWWAYVSDAETKEAVLEEWRHRTSPYDQEQVKKLYVVAFGDAEQVQL